MILSALVGIALIVLAILGIRQGLKLRRASTKLQQVSDEIATLTKKGREIIG